MTRHDSYAAIAARTLLALATTPAHRGSLDTADEVKAGLRYARERLDAGVTYRDLLGA